MKKELLTTLCLVFATQSPLFAQEDAPKWMRWSAISPDGKNIAFSAYGDIYLVPVSGGKAQETHILYFALRPPISLLLSTIPKKLSPW